MGVRYASALFSAISLHLLRLFAKRLILYNRHGWRWFQHYDVLSFAQNSTIKNVQGRTFFINFLFEVLIATPSLVILYHNYLNFVRAVFLI